MVTDTDASDIFVSSDKGHPMRSARRRVTFHLPSQRDTRNDPTSRFQEVMGYQKEQKSAREEHRRKVREARALANEALEKVSPLALMTES